MHRRAGRLLVMTAGVTLPAAMRTGMLRANRVANCRRERTHGEEQHHDRCEEANTHSNQYHPNWAPVYPPETTKAFARTKHTE